jgi:hypothetical protein
VCASVYVYACVCVCVRMRVCVCACVRVCGCVSVRIRDRDLDNESASACARDHIVVHMPCLKNEDSCTLSGPQTPWRKKKPRTALEPLKIVTVLHFVKIHSGK